MIPIDFKEANVKFAADQKEYLTLPAHRADNGLVISCWKLSWWDIFRLLFTRRLWLLQLTFNDPLQPQKPQIERPFQ